MKTQDIRNMGLAMQQVQEADAVGADGAISGRDDDPAVIAARKKMRADHAAKKAAGNMKGKPDLSGASTAQLKAILKAKNSDRNKPKNEEVEVQEAGTATHKPNNGSDPEQGLSPNAKKEKARTSGVGVDANKAIDMSFKAFKAMNKTAPQNGGRNPPGDKAIVKSTMAPAANQKTEAVQVDELSKGTMGSYVKRATSDMAVTNMAKGMAMSKNKGKIASDLRKDANKRKAGVAMAVDKMVKAAYHSEDMDTMKKGAADMMKKTGTPMPAKKKNPSLTDLANLVKNKMKKEDNTNMKSDDGEGLDKVQPKAVKKKFANRKDKDIDNDGDTDSSDEYLHKRRKAISMARKGKGKVGEKAVMHGGKSGDKKSTETMNVGEER